MMRNSRTSNIEKKEDCPRRILVLSLIATLILLFSLTIAGQAFGETIYAGSPSVITVPIELTQESDIRNIDIEIAYPPDVIGAGEVTLAGGILEEKNYTLVNNETDGTLIIVIYARQETVKAQGDLLFISFNVEGESGTTSSISLTKFEYNDLAAEGGFRVNETITDLIDIVINSPPVAEDIQLETDEDTQAKGTLTATDSDEDPLTYTIVENGTKGTAAIADETNSEFIYTPTPDANGTDSFTYKVNDGFSDSNTATVTIDISAMPDPPRFTSTEITESSQDTEYVYAVTATDPDADDTLTLTATEPPAWLTFTDNGDGTGTLTGMPSNDDVGVHNVVLIVTDVQGAAATQSFDITVSNINDPPEFTSEPIITAIQNETYAYAITGTDIDADDTLTFSAQLIPDWLSLSDNGDGTALLTGIPANENIGDNAVTLEVTDAEGASDIQSFIITVSDVNDAPVFTSEPIITATQDSLYTYAAVAIDPDTPDASLIISAPILPDWLNFEDKGDGTGELAGTPANSDVGEHSVVLQAKNDENMAGTQKFIITVSNINDPPVFTSNPVLKAWQDTDYRYAVTAKDPDMGDILTINAPEIPSWLTFRDNGDGTGSLMGTPGITDTGEHSIRLKVKDAADGIGTQKFIINVSGPNTEPAFTSAPITGGIADIAYTYTITAADPDTGDTLVLSSRGLLPDWLVFTDNGDGTALLSGTPAEANMGEYAINLQVKDPAGATDTQSFTIQVSAFSTAPIFITEPPICALKDTAYSYRFAVAAPGTAGILTISGLTLPDWLLLEDNGDGTGYLKGTPADTGDDEAVLEVKNESSETDAQSFTIHVLETNSAPRFTSTPLTESSENTEYHYSVTAEDADSCGGLAITAPVLPDWLRLTDNRNGTADLIGTPGTSDIGTHSIKLRVEDALGMAEVQKFSIRVLNISNPPVFTSTPIDRAVKDMTYRYEITAQDPDILDTLVITATILPEWLILTDNGDGTAILSGTPKDTDIGTHDVRLEVTDAEGAGSIQTFAVTVLDVSGMPIFTSSPVISATEDLLYTYLIQTEGPGEAAKRTIAAPLLPEWLHLTDTGNGTATLSGTPGDSELGKNQVALKVTNAAGASDIQEFEIIVENINDVPVIMGQNELKMPENTTRILQVGDLKIADPDNIFPNDFTLTLYEGENYTYEANKITPTPDFEGILTVPVSINDGQADSGRFQLRIKVNRVNKKPAAESQTVAYNEDTDILIVLNANDEDIEDKLTYIITALPLNGLLYQTSDSITRGAVIDTVPAAVSSEKHEVIYVSAPDGSGLDHGTFRFKVNDGTADSDEATIVVNVTAVNDAPLLAIDREAVLTSIMENDASPTGDGVADIVQNLISDVDGPSSASVAVTFADNTHGVWQYSPNGMNWLPVSDIMGELADISAFARLLPAGYKIRFLPNKDWSGTASLTFRAWDMSGGIGTGIADTSQNGGSTPFSADINMMTITVNALPVSGLKAVNDSPTVLRDETLLEASVEQGNNVTYTWDFGDGTSDTGISPSHVYIALGTYSATVTAENSVSTEEASTSVTVCAESLTVTNNENDGTGSLRWAAENICNNGVILFAPNLPKDIPIKLDEPVIIRKNAAIQNTGAQDLKISGDGDTRIFEIEKGAAVQMEGLNLTLGRAADGFGGAIYNKGELILRGCTIFDNSADPGIAIDDGTEIRWISKRIVENTSGELIGLISVAAGGVFNSGTVLMENCTISGNTAQSDAEYYDGVNIRGGGTVGGFFNSGTATFRHCTVFENSGDAGDAPGRGVGGVFQFEGELSLRHTIIAGNAGTDAADVSGTFISRGYNLIGDSSGSQGFANDRGDWLGNSENPMDPVLGLLSNNGGLTRTHALNPGSPAIDAGNPKINTLLLSDQRGEDFPRIYDGDGDGEAVIDIGAYELSFGFISVPMTAVKEGEMYVYHIATMNTNSAYRITSRDPLPSWLSLTDNNDGTAVLAGTPEQQDVGNYAIKLQLENIVSHASDTQSFNIRVIDVNMTPIITGQKELNTPKQTSISITLDDLIVADQDNRYPDDFTLKLEDGEGYTLEDNFVMPAADFVGTLKIPAIVSDGTDDSNVFYLTLSVTEENRIPVITGQDDLFTAQETPLIIMLNRLSVTDPDNAYPGDFTLTVYDGENYTRNANIITPIADFVGTLKVPVSVNDGTDDSDTFDLTVTVIDVSENVPPVITGQNALSVTEGTSLTIRRTHLTVTDPDNTYPEDFTLTVYDGENYTRENNTIMPAADFVGMLKIPVSVNDGTDDSDIFDLEVTVTASGENIPPVITGQKDLSVIEGEPLTIRRAYLRVTDPDNAYPEDFTFTIGDGENYTHTGRTVTPVPDFAGILRVPVTVDDGTSESDPFMLRITVTAKEHMRSISGTVMGLGTDDTAEINVVSPFQGISRITELTGTGQPLHYTVTDLEPADDYRIEISSSDYLYQAYNQKDSWETADILDLSDGNASGIDFRMIPGTVVISGTVEFPADASPGETAWVNVYSPSTGAVREVSAELRDTDDPQVPYAVTNLLNTGDYIVSVWSDEYRKAYYDGTESGTRKEQNALPVAGGTVNFRLEKGASISGTLFGTDISEILVEAWSESTGTGNTASPSENGDYIIEGLESAPDFKVSAWKPDVPPFFYHTEGTVRTRDFAEEVSTEYENPVNIDMEISEGGSIRGTVYGFAGEPVPYIWVDAWSESQQTGGGVFTGQYGIYEIKGLPLAGDYKVSALPDSSMSYMPAEKTGIPGGSIGIDLILPEKNAYMITGVIQDSEGNYIPNVEVEITSDSQDFYGWNTATRDVSEALHLIEPYRITGLPEADDYVITARPPKNLPYTAFSKSDISISGDTVFDIVLEPALKISGSVFGKDDLPIKGVRIIASSADENFHGEGTTDRNGFYEITNVPDAWDYIISAIAEGYAVQEKLEQSPGTGIDFTLEFGGSINGEITDEDGPMPDVFIEIYSESAGTLPYYSGGAISDSNGRFVVNHLRTAFEDGTPVNDYVVTAYPDGYPSVSERQKSPGDEVVFVLALLSYDTLSAIGISGSVRDADGNLIDDAVVDIFEKDGDFVTTADIASDGTFYACDLPAEKSYQLKFIAFLGGSPLIQWAGEDHIGFDDPDPDGEKNPSDAKAYRIGETADFRFGRHPDAKTGDARQSELSSESSIRNLRITPSEIVSRNPNITAVWDSADPEEKYYYLFNRESDFRITKRNAPAMRPVRTKMVSSKTLTGDDIFYYFHVASIDKRGRISETETEDFRIDTVAPSNASLTTVARTVNSIINLTLSATGAAEMYISNTNYGEGSKWEKWSRSREWKLSKGDGAKKIYVQFRDKAGNTANVLGFTEKVGYLPNQYWITAVAGENGTIIPSGDVSVYLGDDVTFSILPDPGYETDAVYVDGNPVILSDESQYTFRNISADASFAVTFKLKPVIFHVLKAVAGENGSISPSGEVTVNEGDDIVFTVTPDPGYEVDTAMLDGKKVKLRADSTFKFINIDREYALSLTFKVKTDR
jgi:hypothetical protein